MLWNEFIIISMYIVYTYIIYYLYYNAYKRVTTAKRRGLRSNLCESDPTPSKADVIIPIVNYN